MRRQRLAGWRGGLALALALGLVPVTVGFAAPAGYLLDSVLRCIAAGLPERFHAEAGYTVLYAGLATALTVIAGLLVAVAPGPLGRRTGQALIRAAGLGFAMPGTVLAGLLAPLAFLDSTFAVALGLKGTGLALVGHGSGAALVTGYGMRFQTISSGTTQARLARIPASLPEAARLLGRGRLATLVAV